MSIEWNQVSCNVKWLWECTYTGLPWEESRQATLAISLLLAGHRRWRWELPTYRLYACDHLFWVLESCHARNSYWARVRLLGYALLMLLSQCCLLSIHSVYWESFFTISPTFQTPSKANGSLSFCLRISSKSCYLITQHYTTKKYFFFTFSEDKVDKITLLFIILMIRSSY